MRESDPSEGSGAENIPRCWFIIQSEKEPWLRVDESMSEAIEHNTGDIALGIEPGRSEHIGQLFADLPFIVGIRCGKQFGPSFTALLGQRKTRLCEIDEEGKDGRQIGANNRRVHAELRHLSNFDKMAESFKPVSSGDTHLGQKSPVSHGDRKST